MAKAPPPGIAAAVGVVGEVQVGDDDEVLEGARGQPANMRNASVAPDLGG